MEKNDSFATAFQSSLNDEPSTSDGRYTRSSIQNAISQARMSTRDDNVDVASSNLESNNVIPIESLISIDSSTFQTETTNATVTTPSSVEPMGLPPPVIHFIYLLKFYETNFVSLFIFYRN